MLARINGIGNTFLLGSEYAIRIWLDTDKLQGYGLSSSQVLNAINAQNAQFATGSIGADPAVKGQTFTATVSGDTLLFTRRSSSATSSCATNSDGTVVRLSDVARITFGGQNYGQSARYNGQPAGGLGRIPVSRQQRAGDGAKAVKAEMAELAQGPCRRA